MNRWKLGALAVAGVLLISACQTQPTHYGPASYDPPLPCAARFEQRAGLLNLPPTRPRTSSANSREPVQIASTISYDRRLSASAQWTDFNDGWSSLALRLKSVGAQSISVHLTDVALPAKSQIWLCSADGRTQEGPYRQAMDGQLWTSVVPGSEGWLDVLVPSQQRDQFKATLFEIFGGFH
ncbi:MAG: hypothetical protein ACRESS_00165 [Stenotrophobium sp.]